MLQTYLYAWLACLAPLSLTSPTTYRHAYPHLSRRDGIAGGVSLRVLPLGDSITWGERSSDGNGYRGHLYEKLALGNEVEFIGSVRHGSMVNNNSEGHRGFPIQAIMGKGRERYHERPNVVLVMAGTNNFVFQHSPDTAIVALGTLIESIIEACPDAAVLVATLPPLLLNTSKSQQVVNFNLALPGLVSRYEETSKQVALVDMHEIETEHIHEDKIHPTDLAYSIMAEKWYAAIVEAGNRGWIRAPVANITSEAGADAVRPPDARPADEPSAGDDQGQDKDIKGTSDADQQQQKVEEDAQFEEDTTAQVEEEPSNQAVAGKVPPPPQWEIVEGEDDEEGPPKTYSFDEPSLPDDDHQRLLRLGAVVLVMFIMALFFRRLVFATARRVGQLAR